MIFDSRTMKLEDLNIYQISIDIGEKIWNVTLKWDYLSIDTVGKQLVKAVDSVAANISEGFGRYHFKDRKNFCYYARGSLFETKTWLIKAYNRNLLPENEFNTFLNEIEILGVKLNNYINSIGKTTNNHY
jgi:four helix bundle protein